MSVLDGDLLDRIRSRAAGYDRDNAFFTDDLAELTAAGYLCDRSLADASADQRLLAAYAPATALGINMHLVWTAVARILRERGDDSLAWILADAEAGEVFAFGNSEPGNDLVLQDSVTAAVPDGAGGYRFTGTKIFTSLSPAWTRLGVFGRDDSDPNNPVLVHGFLLRRDPGYRILADWDTLGQRATQSHTTVLEGAVVPAARIVRTVPVGPSADPFIFAIFAAFETLIAAVYAGIADRALELAVAAVQRRISRKSGGRPYAEDPDIRWRIADAALALDAVGPQLERVAADVDGLVDHGRDWFRRLVGVKHHSTEVARRVVDQAIRVSGGSSYRADSELARLYRDVAAGIFHPSDPESVHATVAANLLGPLP
ncbi:alkylation response protein AidB-like acyl-CoA dehydrogenase [Glaciihabitans tibetensis]|uniref:Alkylation response protein AidB-like acyl-CoA dehydrogenase n=1 Tax=Glaciihabitans tibetensis TaxID=1266600 RepID=A0A2T0VCD9_9MICO|nr:acyl-CoA dehydrogenase family protein [Glaciihabitans tibetensis]PRY67849.1 alkylation response protein AidB-like acyl-CoA dehydrogenase [Glaciihabitans tibetensis]